MFGCHLSIAGGLHNALLEAGHLQLDCVQLFTKNQRQWRCPPLDPQALEQWRQAGTQGSIQQTVSHDSYLINLASPDGEIRRKSLGLFREELLRCEALGIPWLVTHPGSHMGEGVPAGLRRVAEAFDQLHGELPGLAAVTCLEITAGQGSSLGWRLEQLRQILDSVTEPQRLAVCLDTAHMLAAGYDLTSAAGAEAVLDEVDQIVGLSRVRVVHMNDSKVPLGARVDRHEHIGHGHIPLPAFERLVNDPHLRTIPKVLETPKETAADGRSWDVINLETLRSLVRPA